MNDWVSCTVCKTFYEYDPVRRECPYCKAREGDGRERDERKRDVTPREPERAAPREPSRRT